MFCQARFKAPSQSFNLRFMNDEPQQLVTINTSSQLPGFKKAERRKVGAFSRIKLVQSSPGTKTAILCLE